MLAVERVDEGADDLLVPSFERRHLLFHRALVAGFVGCFDVEEEEVAIGERR